VLPQIAEAVGSRIEVLFDGGIRTGGDIVKALGLGAHACLSGRACLYGLAAKGREGVHCALELFEQELKDCMMLAGLSSVAEVPPGVVTAQPPLGGRR
jgi:L-lactate dehydrogenase (cytochrome)